MWSAYLGLMQYVEVAGVRVSKIGLGCWQFGSREWGYGREYASDEAIKITHKALDLGINLIDTAEIYAFGQSERIVGRAIAGRRTEAFVATKIWPLMPVAPIVVDRGRRSAGRLKIDTIDLYQVHQANPVVPDAATMDGMRQLQRAGTIRHVGVSNYSLDRWKRAERALGSPVVSNQVEYSLAQRTPDQDVVPFAAANDRLIIAYSPLAQGFLAAKYDAHNPPGGVRLTNPLFLEENLDPRSRAAEHPALDGQDARCNTGAGRGRRGSSAVTTSSPSRAPRRLTSSCATPKPPTSTSATARPQSSATRRTGSNR